MSKCAERMRKSMIQHLSQDVWCRIGPGSFGVGVIAVRDIPEGQVVDKVPSNTMPRHMRETVPSTEVNMRDLNGIDPDVLAYLKEMNVVTDGSICLGNYGANCFIGLSHFINHSDPPAANVRFISETDSDIGFNMKIQTMRNIAKGEEVFCVSLVFFFFFFFFFFIISKKNSSMRTIKNTCPPKR